MDMYSRSHLLSAIMGIQDLYALLKSQGIVPQTMALSSFSGQCIAIDTPGWLHRMVKSAGYQWIKEFMVALCLLRKHKITPIFIFDGHEVKPKLKEKEQAKRAKDRLANADLLDRVRQWMYAIQTHQPYPREEALNALRRKKVRHTDPATGRHYYGPDTTITDDLTDSQILILLTDKATTMERQSTSVTKEHVSTAVRLLEAAGIPLLHLAEGEAESVAARLINANKVHAIFTEDGDALAYGCRRLICLKSQFTHSQEKVLVYDLPVILEKLHMSYTKFRDLCILLKCDYNERVKGFPPDGKVHKKPVSIGQQGAWAIFQVCDSLEEAVEYGYIEDPAPLKVDECRHIFSHDMKFTLPPLICQAPNIDAIESILDACFCEMDHNYLERCLSH